MTPKNFTAAMLLIMRTKRLKKRDVKNALGVSYETLEKKFKDPRLFNGYDREILSNQLNLPLEIIDALVSDRLTYAQALEILTFEPANGCGVI